MSYGPGNKVLNKAFVDTGNLKVYHCTHTHEHPRSCDVCNNTVTNVVQSDVSSHIIIRTHNPVKCECRSLCCIDLEIIMVYNRCGLCL